MVAHCLHRFRVPGSILSLDSCSAHACVGFAKFLFRSSSLYLSPFFCSHTISTHFELHVGSRNIMAATQEVYEVTVCLTFTMLSFVCIKETNL